MPGWLWPVVCVLALVVGVLGGVVGGVAYERLSDDPVGTVADGLDGVDTVNEAPLPVDNGSITAVAERLLPSTVQIPPSSRARRAARPAPASCSTGRATSSRTTTSSRTPHDGDGPIEVVDEEGNRYAAEVVGRSPVYDLAVLYVPRGARPPAGSARARRRACASARAWSPSARRSG